MSATASPLARHGRRYVVDGTLPVGRRPVGMSMAPDGRLLVAHHPPRGKVTANEGVSESCPPAARSAAKKRSFTIVQLKDIKCLTDGLMLPPELATAEGVPTQLAGAQSFGKPKPGCLSSRLASAHPKPRPKRRCSLRLSRRVPGEILAPFGICSRDSLRRVRPCCFAGVLDPPTRGSDFQVRAVRVRREQVRNILPDMPPSRSTPSQQR